MKIYINSSAFDSPMGVYRAHIDEGINCITGIELFLVSREWLDKAQQEAVLGEPIQFFVEDIIDDTLHKVRFDGVIFEFCDVSGENGTNGAYYFSVVMRPKLWQLNYHHHARSFPNTSRIQLIDDLLVSHGFVADTTYIKKYLKPSNYPEFPQLLQSNETDLNFLRRLSANSGINFFFAGDDSGEKEESLYLVDMPDFFPKVSCTIPFLDGGRTRHVRELTEGVREVPGQVLSTVYLADGATDSKKKSLKVEGAGREQTVEVHLPEGLKDPAMGAKKNAAIWADRYAATRVQYQGISDHIRMRAARRVQLMGTRDIELLLTRVQHFFSQNVMAALSETGSGDPAYENRFTATHVLSPIRPDETANDVDTRLIKGAWQLTLESSQRRNPKLTHQIHRKFNPKAEPRINTEAIKILKSEAGRLQSKVRDLAAMLEGVRQEVPLGSTGLVAAEITKDAYVTDRKELCCMVKAEPFAKPIVAKVSVMWYSRAGGAQYLPREGHTVWITRVAGAKDNDWVVVGFRPAGSLSMYDPKKSTKIKLLGEVGEKAPSVPPPVIDETGGAKSPFGPIMELISPYLPPGDSDEQPHVVHARLIGGHFDTNKCFLLPAAVPHLAEIKSLYDRFLDYDLLVVGHTDDAGDAADNDVLSLERADATAAFLKDDVDAWYGWYGDDKPSGKQWGNGEDRLMIKSLDDYPSMSPGDDPVRWFQRTRGLTEDGVAGPVTRKALITEYMAHDNTTLPSGMSLTTHGCGAYFPRPDAPPPSEQGAADRHTDIEHRRVEFFFFKPPFGIDPAPPGTNSPEGSSVYTKWYHIADERHDLRLEIRDKKVDILEMHDALFRTNSAVLMPEGEDPSSSDHQSIRTVGLVASALRFNQENPGKQLLVAGHCDTTGTVAFNQPLSEERAQTTLALLVGDREAFKSLCDNRHDDVDLNQIFDWAACEPSLGLNCAPANPGAAANWESINRFQVAYNQWLDEGAAAGETRGAKKLDEDGDAGPLTWGGIFDCYEYALKKELGEEDAGVAELREKLVWVDAEQPWRGFSEHHPVDNLGRDNYRSQANRRVEVLFFDSDEQPDLMLGGGAPEMSDIYLPGHYVQEHLEPMVSAKLWRAYWERQEEAATSEDVRDMILDAPGLPDGTPVVFSVKEQVGEANLDPLLPQTEPSASENAALPFDAWFNEDQATYQGELEEGQSLPKATFTFVVEGGGRRIESKPLPYGDFVDVGFTHEDTDIAIADAPYTVHTAWASAQGRTDEAGRARIEDLPPGGADVVLGECYLVENPNEPVTGGEPDPPEETQTLKLRLVNQDFSPRANIPYRILPPEEGNAWEGESDADGVIRQDISADLTSVRLIVDQCETEIQISEVAAVEETTGIQTRLNNLGYDAGEANGEMNEQTEEAILKFRLDRGLGHPGDGELLDDATRDSLKDAHGY